MKGTERKLFASWDFLKESVSVCSVRISVWAVATKYTKLIMSAYVWHGQNDGHVCQPKYFNCFQELLGKPAAKQRLLHQRLQAVLAPTPSNSGRSQIPASQTSGQHVQPAIKPPLFLSHVQRKLSPKLGGACEEGSRSPAARQHSRAARPTLVNTYGLQQLCKLTWCSTRLKNHKVLEQQLKCLQTDSEWNSNVSEVFTAVVDL